MKISTLTMACCLMLISFMVFRAAQCVSISPALREVVSNTTAEEVVLPCVYTTDSKDRVQIEWSKHHSGRDELVMGVNTIKKMTVGGNFTGRVNRGDSASLILRKPKPKDSGAYKCEVTITSDNPNVDVGVVELTVKLVDCQRKDPCGKCSDNMPQQGGPITMIICIWLVPLISCVIFLLKLRVRQRGFGGPHLLLRIYYVVGIALIAAIGLCLASSVCLLLYASSGCQSPPTDWYLIGGYISGAFGIAVSTFVIGYFIFKWKYPPANGLRADHDKESQELEGALQLIQSDKGHSIYPYRLESFPTKLKKPSGLKINSMTVGWDKRFYICTDEKVYSSELGSAKFDPIDIGTTKEDLFMTTVEKKDLIISIRSKTREKKCKLEFYDLETGKTNTVKLEFSSYCPWVCVGRDDQLYVTDYDKGKLYKVTRSGATRQRIGDGILETPTCVTQNASGHVIVADSTRNDVYIFDEGGRFLSSLKLSVPKELESKWYGPHRLVLNSENDLFVACAFSNTIFVFTEEFRYEKAVHADGEDFGNPWSLFVSDNESTHLYVAYDDFIRIYPQESEANIVKDNRLKMNNSVET